MNHEQRVVDMVCSYFTNHIRSTLRVDISNMDKRVRMDKISMSEETKEVFDKALKLIPDNVILGRKVDKL